MGSFSVVWAGSTMTMVLPQPGAQPPQAGAHGAGAQAGTHSLMTWQPWTHSSVLLIRTINTFLVRTLPQWWQLGQSSQGAASPQPSHPPQPFFLNRPLCRNVQRGTHK